MAGYEPKYVFIVSLSSCIGSKGLCCVNLKIWKIFCLNGYVTIGFILIFMLKQHIRCLASIKCCVYNELLTTDLNF